MSTDNNSMSLRDVALRESAQVPGGTMTPTDQLEYVRLLLEGGIDAIEIGFPASSDEQFNQCSRVVEYVKKWNGIKKPILSGLARAVKTDIDTVKKVGCDCCHVYIPLSDSLLLAQFNATKYGKTEEDKRKWVIDQAVKMVSYAKSLGFKYIEFSPEDAARASEDFLCEIIRKTIAVGANIINIPDTTGLRIGSEFGDLIKRLFEKIPNINDTLISVHCHNDSDHSTHNALQAILAGARCVEGTFFGLGERSGMTKFESVIMNIETRRDIFENIKINFNPDYCVEIVYFIAHALGMEVPRHWVVTGTGNADNSAGTHQSIESRVTENSLSPYYSWDPSRFGHIGGVKIAITQSSGKDGLKGKLLDLGYRITNKEISLIHEKAKRLSGFRVGEKIDDRELVAIVQEVISEVPCPIKIERCQIIGGKGTIPSASVKIAGNNLVVSETGNGPYNAAMSAVTKAASILYPVLNNFKITLNHWSVLPIGEGSDTLADTFVRIKVEDDKGAKTFSGKSVDPDTGQATAQAFANCLSWLLYSLSEQK